MERTNKQIAKAWSASTVTAVALIVAGVVLFVLTFLSVIGPILGVMMIVIGVYILRKTPKAAGRIAHPSAEDKANAEERTPERGTTPPPGDAKAETRQPPT
jgi:hypothetical protein